jgi:hypothetical protein
MGGGLEYADPGFDWTTLDRSAADVRVDIPRRFSSIVGSLSWSLILLAVNARGVGHELKHLHRLCHVKGTYIAFDSGLGKGGHYSCR